MVCKMAEGDLEVSAMIPDGVNRFEYVRNHHYIKLARKDGREIKLIPEGRLRYYCEACTFDMITNSNHGELKCPVCGTKMVSQWGKEQICFIPEKESDFEF